MGGCDSINITGSLLTEPPLTLVLATRTSLSRSVHLIPRSPVVLVTTPSSLTGSNLQTSSKIDGGAGADSVSFGGDLSGGIISGGADNDTLNFSAGVNNSAIVSGDAGSDLLLFSSTISAAIYGNSGGDSMVFKGAITSSTH